MVSRKRIILLLWLVCLTLAGWWLAGNLRPQSDLSLFLPQGHSSVQQLLLNELRQGQASRLLLIGISGGNAEGRADLSQRLVGALSRSGLFERVENGAPGELGFDPQLLRYRYLLTPKDRLKEALDTTALRSTLEARLEELNTPLPNPFRSIIPRDPTGAYTGLLARLQPQHRISRTAGVWASREGDVAILLAVTLEGGLALDQQSRTLEQIRNQFHRLNPESGYHLILSGPGAFGALSKELIKTESQRLSLFASGAVTLLLLLAYRYPPYLLYAALPLASGILAAIMVSMLLFDRLHGITLAFGITLLGVTLDYPVHLFSHLIPGEPPQKTMHRIWPTLWLGVITTCLGYSVLVATDFTGLRQIGTFTLAGLLTAALVSRYLLPLLLTGSASSRPPRQRLPALLNKRGWIPIGVMAAITLLAALHLSGNQTLWNDDVAVLSPIPPDILAQDRYLRRQLMIQESSRMILLEGEDMEQLLVRCESLREQLDRTIAGELADAVSLPCDYLPSRHRQAANQRAIPSHEEMARRLSAALEGLPFRAGAFDDFLDDLRASLLLTPLRYEDLGAGPLRERLASQLRSRKDGMLAMAPLPDVKAEDGFKSLLQQAQPGVELFNLRQETSSLIGGFRQEILQQMTLGILIMVLVLWFGLRSLLHACGVLAPVSAAILTTLALLVWGGETLNLFHLISLMLVLGIGIDFSLFFSQERLNGTMSGHTLHALTLCALSTTSVFAILGSTTIAVLHAIGTTVAVGVFMSYLATYAFWRMPWKPPGRGFV